MKAEKQAKAELAAMLARAVTLAKLAPAAYRALAATLVKAVQRVQ